jgi:hypothetical protein
LIDKEKREEERKIKEAAMAEQWRVRNEKEVERKKLKKEDEEEKYRKW